MASVDARMGEKSRSWVTTTKPRSRAHAMITASVAVGSPVVLQWTASNPFSSRNLAHVGDRFMSRRASWKGQFDFLSAPGGIRECRANVVGLQVGIGLQDLLVSPPITAGSRVIR